MLVIVSEPGAFFFFSFLITEEILRKLVGLMRVKESDGRGGGCVRKSRSKIILFLYLFDL